MIDCNNLVASSVSKGKDAMDEQWYDACSRSMNHEDLHMEFKNKYEFVIKNDIEAMCSMKVKIEKGKQRH